MTVPDRHKKVKTQLQVLNDGRKLMFSLCWYENSNLERISEFFLEDSGVNGMQVPTEMALELLNEDGYDVSKVPLR